MTRYFLLFFISLLAACEWGAPSGDLLHDKIDYWVEIGNPSEYTSDPNWLNADARKELITDLLHKARSGALPVFYYMDDTLMAMEQSYLDELFHRVDSEFVDLGNGEYQVVKFEEKLNPDAIVRLKFREQWYWDKSNNTFHKKVIAICPMIERYKNLEEILGYTGLFWIYLDPEMKIEKE